MGADFDGDKKPDLAVANNGSSTVSVLRNTANLPPPFVTREKPNKGETGVARNTNVTATFSRPMDPSTINTSTVTMKMGKKKVPVAVSCDSSCTTVTLDPFPSDPSQILAAHTKFKVTITTGAKDLAGTALDQNFSTKGNQAMVWTFTTGSS